MISGLAPPDGDDGILDDIFDAAADRFAAGSSVDVHDLVGNRPDLHDKAAEVVRLAREVALVASRPTTAIPGYEIVHELGSGGSGTVYLARQIALGGRLVALKVLNSAVTGSHAHRRFLTEARTLAHFRHPHLVPVFDVVDAGGICAFAMEWVSGRSLADLLAAIRSAPERSRTGVIAYELGADGNQFRFESALVFFCRTMIAAGRALGAMHRAGLLHRDVKPSNILIASDGTAFLSDLGLVRDPEHSLHTQTGVFLGTPAYAAPEQLRGDHAATDGRSDVYSLGATFYECATLQTPFGKGSAAESMRRRETGSFVPMRKLNPEIPRDLGIIAGKALESEPSRRYMTAEAFADDLERFLALRPIEARPVGPITRALRFARRHRAPIAAGWVGAVCVMVFFLFIGNPFAGEVRAAPHGSVRFFNMTPDLVVERNIGGRDRPRWARLALSESDVVDLPPGLAQLRVRRKNCFPYIIPFELDIAEGKVLDQEFKAMPIVQSQFPTGPPRHAAVPVDRLGGGKQLLVQRWSVPVAVDALSGRPEVEPGVANRPAQWVLRQATEERQALVGSLVEKMILTRELRADQCFWAKGSNPGERTYLCAHPLPDLDGDGVLDLAAVRDDGALIIVFAGTPGGEERQLCNLPGAAWKAMTAGAGHKSAPWIAVIGVGGRANRVLVVDVRSGAVHGSCEVPQGADTLFGVERSDGTPRVIVVGLEGCWLADPWSAEPVRGLAEGAADAAPARRAGHDESPGVVVASSTGLALFDLTGMRIWEVPIEATAPLRVAAGDLDAQPGDEIVLGSADGIVRAYSGETGEEVWTFETRGAIVFPPIVDDLDGDGFGEVIVHSADENVYVLAGSPGYRLWIADVGWPLGGQANFVRLNDGSGVVIAAGAGVLRDTRPFELGMPGPSIRAYKARTGAPMWRQAARVAFLTSPDIKDLDGDGAPEALGQDRSGRLVSFRVSDGEPCVELGLVAADAFHHPPPRVVDAAGQNVIVACVTELREGVPRARIDSFDPRSRARLWSTLEGLPREIRSMEPGIVGPSGRTVLVCGSVGEGVFLLDVVNGRIVGRVAGGLTIHAPVAVEDVTGDGADDLIVAVHKPESSVVVFDGLSLDEVWSAAINPGGIDARPAVGDVDGNGSPDVVTADFSGCVRAFRGGDGVELWTKTMPPREAIFSSPVIADVDGDGLTDIVVGIKGEKLRMTAVLDGRTGEVKRTIGAAAEVWGTALIADLDGDGTTEIVIGDDGGTLSAIPGRGR